MQTFSFSLSPDGKRGTIKAATMIAAARRLIAKPIYCSGNRYCQPVVYVSDPSGQELRLWPRLADEDTGDDLDRMNQF
jgi:hypothetical protein